MVNLVSLQTSEILKWKRNNKSIVQGALCQIPVLLYPRVFIIIDFIPSFENALVGKWHTLSTL